MATSSWAHGRARPALLPTLVTVPMLVVLLGLGTWQVERLEWKEALIAERTANLGAPPVPLPGADADLSGFAFRPVTVTGRFLHARELHLVATSRRGDAGYHVITPLERVGGGIVLVDRGWVPMHRRAATSRAEGQLGGVVSIEGIARPGGAPGWFTPENDPEKGLWYWRDVEGMAAHLGLTLQPLLVDAGPAPNPGGLPVGGQTRRVLRNAHLGYAVTWYGLAAALAVVYGLCLLHLRRPQG